MYYTNKLKICIKDEKFEILHFNRYVKKHKYIHNLLNLYSNTVSKSMQKSIQHEKKVYSQRFYPSMLHDHFIKLPPNLEKRKTKKEKKYKVEKHHIYNTMTPIYTIIDSKKKLIKNNTT